MLPKKILPFLIFLFALTPAVFAQSPYPPPPTPDPEIQRQMELRNIRRHMDVLESISRGPTQSRKIIPQGPATVLLAQYRRSTLEELQLLAPEHEDALKYADFLRQKNTGLMKLVIDLGCDEYSVKSQNSRICDKFSMPGGGSAFSFRQKDYQMWKLADLLYDGNSLIAFGQISQGFLVNLGDVPLKNIRRETGGLDYFYSFAPAIDLAAAANQNKQFVDGYSLNGFNYFKLLSAVENNTFVLRSIAYQGNAPRTERGLVYNELDYDKRDDVIVAFRIVRKDFNGTLTILWKILQSKPSPNFK